MAFFHAPKITFHQGFSIFRNLSELKTAHSTRARSPLGQSLREGLVVDKLVLQAFVNRYASLRQGHTGAKEGAAYMGPGSRKPETAPGR